MHSCSTRDFSTAKQKVLWSFIILALFLNGRCSLDEDFVRKVKRDVEFYVNKSTSLRRALLFPPLPSHYRFLIHKVIEECEPDVNLKSLSVGENEHRRTLVYFGRNAELTDNAMPKGNDSISGHNTSHVSSDLPKRNMTADEISPSSMRERNRRPDKQLYVPKARRLSDCKEKCAANDESPPLNGPRKVLSNVQHKQTEGSSRCIRDENDRSKANRPIALQADKKGQPKERRSSKLQEPLNRHGKAKPVGVPVASSEHSRVVVVPAERSMRNDADRVIVQGLPAEIGCMDVDKNGKKLPLETTESPKQQPPDDTTKNNRVLPSAQNSKHRTKKVKPAHDRTIVSNCVVAASADADVDAEDACPEESSGLCIPTVIKPPRDVSLRYPGSGSPPAEQLENVGQAQSSPSTMEIETLNGLARTPLKFMGEINNVRRRENEVIPKDEERNWRGLLEDKREGEKDGVILSTDCGLKPDCAGSHQETAASDAMREKAAGEIPTRKTYPEISCKNGTLERTAPEQDVGRMENEEISTEGGTIESGLGGTELSGAVSETSLEVGRKNEATVLVAQEQEGGAMKNEGMSTEGGTIESGLGGTAMSDAVGETPLEISRKSEAAELAAQEQEIGPMENERNRNDGEFPDVKNVMSAKGGSVESSFRVSCSEIASADFAGDACPELTGKIEGAHCAEPQEEILPSRKEEKIETVRDEVISVVRGNASDPEENQKGSGLLGFTAKNGAAGENRPSVKIVREKKSSPRTIVQADKRRSNAPKNVTSSARDDSPVGDEEESWEALYDDSGECLDQSVVAQLSSTVGDVRIEHPQIDYLSFQAKEPVINDDEFGHVVEIYSFPAEFKTEDLKAAFSPLRDQAYDIKWVNDTHALAVFSSRSAAECALTLQHPMMSTRPLSQGIKDSKLKARRCSEFLKPYKQRPETSASLARRLVVGALGLSLPVSKQQREDERRKLREAKERKQLAKKQREDAWEGTVGNGE